MLFWQPYFIALMIGLLIGIEREKSRQPKKSMGIRTFMLISLLGAVAGGLETLWMSVSLTVFALSLIAISYFNQTRKSASSTDIGLTTEFAAGLVFFLSYVSHTSPALAAVAGPIVAVILFAKSPLHRFTDAIKPSELQAALFLFLSAVVVVNLVPDTPVDRWGIFNPRKFGYLVLVLASIEFLSYVLAKVVGERKGLLVTGFLGGFVSSTAVLLSSARQAAASPGHWRTLLSSVLAANLASFLELLLIVLLVSVPLFTRLLLPMGAGLVVGGALLALLARHKEKSAASLKVKSPLDWIGVLRLAIALAAILALISFTKLWLGESASMAVSFMTGLFELHGVSLANATMFSHNQIELQTASLNIYLAIVASILAKIAIAWAISGKTFAKALTATLVLIILAISIGGAWHLLQKPRGISMAGARDVTASSIECYRLGNEVQNS